MPKISIIIPVYNVEKYLRKCLESCVNQTFKDIEIIVVNDASPDNSDSIMKEYERKYPDLIKCIYLKQNIKLGGARNRGIETAKGDYIMFVDSDDWIALDMCEKMYNFAILNKSDIIICNYYNVTDSDKIQMLAFSQERKSLSSVNKEKVFKNSVNVIACSKLYKRNIILKSSCLFPEHIFFEDNSVVWIWLLSANKISYLNEPLYYYFYRDDSITNSQKSITKTTYKAKALIALIENSIKSDLIKKYEHILCKFIFIFLNSIINEYIIYFLHQEKNINFLSEEINRLLPKWHEKLDFADASIRNNIGQFLSDKNCFQKLINRNISIINDIKNERITVWGAGSYGKNTICYLKQFNLTPEYVIDSSKKVQGGFIEDIKVVPFEEDLYCDTIIISIKDLKIYNEIKKIIMKTNKNIKIIHCMELFTLGDGSEKGDKSICNNTGI